MTDTPTRDDLLDLLRRINVARATLLAGGPTDRVLRQAHDVLAAALSAASECDDGCDHDGYGHNETPVS